MIKYESPRYKELGFYVGESFRRFRGGVYSTEDADEIIVLDALVDVIRVEDADEIDVVKPEEPAEPAPKAPKRKPSAK